MRSTVRSGKTSERDELKAENDKIAGLWIAAKHLDRSKIHRCLMNYEALDEIRQFNRKSLVQSSNAALVLQSLFFAHLEIRTTDALSAEQQSTKDSFDLTDKEKRIMYLRAMLLLPPYSLTPWEVISAIIKTIHWKMEKNRSHENQFDASEMLQRKTICDIKIFFSSICEGGGNADDHRSMDSQKKMMKEVCKDIAELIYKHRNVTFLVRRAMFQLLTSLFRASLRIDDKIGISACDDRTTQLSEFMLINIFNHNGCVTVNVQSPVLCFAISMASTDLLEHLTTNHWRSLQRFVLDNICTCTAFKELNGLARVSIQGISRDHSNDNGCNESWNGWVEIFLHAYQKLSSDEQSLKSIEAQIIAALSVMQSATIASFVSVVVQSKQCLKLDNHVLSLATFPKIQLWVRVNALLLLFQSEESVAKYPCVVTKTLSAESLSSENEEEKSDHQLHVSARELIDIIKDHTIKTEDDSYMDLTVCTNDAMVRVAQQFDHISPDVSDFQEYFTKCRIIMRRSIFLKGDGILLWSREYLWKRLARYLMSHYRPDGECENYIAFASAILVVLYLELPSCRQGVIQHVVDVLQKNPDTDADSHGREIGYCWVLFVISNTASKSNISCYEDNKTPFGHFSVVFQALRSSIYTIPRSIYLAILQSLVCIPGGRMAMLELGLKQVHSDKLLLHFGDNIELKGSWGYDGLLFLNQKNLQTDCILDKPALEALCFISDEIVGEEASSIPSSWRLDMFAKIIAACRSGFLHNDAIERILNATVARLLPGFLPMKDSTSNNGRDSYELEFVTRATIRNCYLPQEIPFLVLLLLASLQHMSIPLNWRDLSDVLVSEGYGNATCAAGISDRQEKIVLLAIYYIKALIGIPRVPSFGPVEDNQRLHLLGWRKQLFESETEFWRVQNIDVCPTWPCSPLILRVDEELNHNDYSLSKEVISSMQDQISCSIADGLLCLWNDSHSTTCAENKDEFKFAFLVSSVLSCSRFPNVRIGSNKQEPLCFRISVLETFFNRSAKVFQAMAIFDLCEKEKKTKYIQMTLSVLRMMSTRIGALMNCSYFGGLSTSSLYRSVVEFYCVCFDREDDEGDPEISSQTFSRAILSTLDILLQSSITSSSVTKVEMIQVLQCHCRLFLMMCKELKEFTSQSVDQIKIMETLIHCLKKMCNSRQFMCVKNFESAQTCADHIRASIEILWKTLQSFNGGKRSIFMSLISIVVSLVPRLLRVLDRLTGVTSSSSIENIATDMTLRFSYSVVSFEMCVEDCERIASFTNENQVNPKFSWISTNDFRLRAWSLSISVKNIASLWADANPTNTGISLLDQHLSYTVDLQNPRTFKYAIERVFELESSLSLVNTLLKITDTEISSDMNQLNQQLYTLIWEIMSTVSSSVNVITSHHGGEKPMDLDNMRSTLSLVEAIICIFAVIKAAMPPDKLSRFNRFVNIASKWCRKQSDYQAVKINGLVYDLNVKLMECSQEMKADTIENRVICKMFRSLTRDNSIASPSNAIDAYLESSGFDLVMNKMQKVVSSKQRPGRVEISKKRRRSHRRGRKQGRSRNNVVNEWLELDQSLKESANDGFGDLDDFILPG